MIESPLSIYIIQRLSVKPDTQPLRAYHPLHKPLPQSYSNTWPQVNQSTEHFSPSLSPVVVASPPPRSNGLQSISCDFCARDLTFQNRVKQVVLKRPRDTSKLDHIRFIENHLPLNLHAKTTIDCPNPPFLCSRH